MAATKVSPPPIQGRIVDTNGYPTKVLVDFMHRLWKLTADPSGNFLTQTNNAATNGVSAAAAAAESAAEAINLAGNAGEGVTIVAEALDDHEADDTAHGSNGSVIGADDTATELSAGLVKMSSAITDAANTTASAVSAVSSAPAAYDQTYIDTLASAINAQSDAINQIITDYDSLAAKLNALLAAERLSGQLST